MIVQDFLFRKCRQGICRVAKRIANTLFHYQAVYVMWFTHKNNIVRGLVDGDKNIFVMEERQVFTLTLVYIKCNSLGFLRKNIEVSNRFTKCQTSGIHWEPGIICLAVEHPCSTCGIIHQFCRWYKPYRGFESRTSQTKAKTLVFAASPRNMQL